MNAPAAAGATASRPRAIPAPAVWSAAVALLALPLVYLPDAHSIYDLPKATVFRAAVLLMLLTGFMRLLARGRRPLVLRLPDVLLVGHLGWLAVSASASGWPVVSILGTSPRYEGLLGFAGYAAFFWTASRVSLPQARLLLRATALSGALLGLVALVEMLGPFRPPGYALFGLRATTTMGNPVFLGAWTAMAIPATLTLACLVRRRVELILIGPALALQAAGLYLSAGRAAWLGALVGLVLAGGLMLVVRRAARRRTGDTGVRGRGVVSLRRPGAYGAAALVIVVAAVALTAAFAPGVSSSGARLGEAVEAVTQGGSGGSAEARLVMWRATLELVREHPLLGSGLETFLGEFPRVRPLRTVQLEGAAAYPDRPHNHWLYLLYAAGLPALALHVAFLLSVAVPALRSLVGSRGSAWQRTAAVCALLGGAVAYEIQALFSFSLVSTTPAAMTLLGLAAAFTSRGEPTRPIRLPAIAPRIAGVAALVLALAVLSTGIRDTWADREFSRANREPSNAVALTSRAVSLSPRDAGYTLGNGRALELAARDRGDPALLARALEVYQEGGRRLPHHPDILFSVARVQALQGHPQSAALTYEDVLSRDPYHAGALFNLAAIRLSLGEPAAAEPLVARILSYDDADAGAWYLLGRARDALGRVPEARAAYEAALLRDPALADAQAALERLSD